MCPISEPPLEVLDNVLRHIEVDSEARPIDPPLREYAPQLAIFRECDGFVPLIRNGEADGRKGAHGYQD